MKKEEVIYSKEGDRNMGNHPSFGVVSVSKVSCTGTKLVDTPGKIGDYLTLTISPGIQMIRDGESKFFTKGGRLIEISLSRSQFTDMITNLNTEGSPCTIDYIGGEEIPRLTDNYKEGFDLLIEDTMEELGNMEDGVDRDQQEFNEILAKKTINKGDREKLKTIYSGRYKTMKSNINYYMKNMGEVSAKLAKKIAVNVMDSIKRKMDGSKMLGFGGDDEK